MQATMGQNTQTSGLLRDMQFYGWGHGLWPAHYMAWWGWLTQ